MSIEDNIMKEYHVSKNRYDNLLANILSILKQLLDVNKIVYSSVTGRLKEESSLREKIQRKNGKYQKLSDITDIVGIRITMFYADDVDKIASLIEKEFVVDREKTIDKRKALDPDRFGYMSLHYVVQISQKRYTLPEYADMKNMKFEIQIRSILQHMWAEIEHDLGYKSEIEIPKEIRRDFSRLAGLLEIADKEFMEIRDNLNIYESELNKKMNAPQKNYEDITIDLISLGKYINTSSNIQNLNREMKKNTDLIIKASDTKFLSELVSTLFLMKITTLSQLETLYREHHKLALYIFKNHHSLDSIPFHDLYEISNSTCILYLCYAKLCTDTSITREEKLNIIKKFYSVKSTDKILKGLAAIYQSYLAEY